MNTVASLLKKTSDWFQERGIDSPRLDAELLLCHVLKEKRIQLYMDPERIVEDDDLSDFRKLVKRRGQFEPIAYIFGEKEFWGRTFQVSNDVLIPRPDTERLVELCLEHLPPSIEGRVVEFGTGSGCIAITLAAERPGLFVVATDISEAALHIAKENAERHKVRERLAFRQGDLWNACEKAADLVLVVSNPPYIPRAQQPGLMADIQFHEPHLALFDDEEGPGTSFHRRIIEGTAGRLSPNGFVAMEIGFDQGQRIRELKNEFLPALKVFEDFGGNPRVALFKQQQNDFDEEERVLEEEPEHQNHREIDLEKGDLNVEREQTLDGKRF
ncbi:MAG: peptide chain release factor N(5)-glutamine methyltransferase [Deltaproteobacteria bacterium]|nr:peptide chain release factor N(5)-glutamine methyltransferase [Deltaproteobacteria bacterium]